MNDWMTEPPAEPGWYYELLRREDYPDTINIRVVEVVRVSPASGDDPLSGLVHRTFSARFSGEGWPNTKNKLFWWGPIPAPSGIPPIPWLNHARR